MTLPLPLPSSHRKVHPLPIQRMTERVTAFTQKASVFGGKFVGNGTAYHHGNAVQYVEECSFTVVRKNPNMVVYRVQQDTRHAEQDKPMHLEMGVLKILYSDNDVLEAEAGLVHPFASGTVNELAKGTLDTTTGTLTLESTGFQRVNESSSDKHVTALKRVYRRQGNRHLTCDQFLGVNGGELTHHLHCELELQE